MTSKPISPKPVTGHHPDYLPAYISNGLIGLRVREIPLLAGVASVSGLSGVDPVSQIIGSPYAPYPLAGDIQLGGLSLSQVGHLARFVEQAYDFSCGELTSRFEFGVPGGALAQIEVLTFCSRTRPMLVLQETRIVLDAAEDVVLSAIVDPDGIAGSWDRRWTEVPGEKTDLVDGALSWKTFGDVATMGVAYSSEFVSAAEATRSRANESQAPLATHYAFRAEAGRRYVLRQIAAMVPSAKHHQPEAESIRLVAEGCLIGFEGLRCQNQEDWANLWCSRIVLRGADRKWQALADAAFFYLQTSAHPSSSSSVHIFGLARWPNYHYYHGHVMWDVESFVLPPLLLLQPEAARGILEFRSRTLTSARMNAVLRGARGVLYPWESDPELGEEATLGTATGVAHEEHVNLSVALAFAQYVHATGDEWFLRDQAWPVMRGVAEWICGRVECSKRGYEIRRTSGIAERKQPADNVAYVNMAASVTLRETASAARRLGFTPPPIWEEIANHIVIPLDERSGVIRDHDGFRRNEEKGATPGPLAGLFPVGYEVSERVERATTKYYLDCADDYIGSPMLSALYGAWAARIGDRAQALRGFEEGYAAFVSDRFMNTHEYREDRWPEQPIAGPFFANMGGFLMALLYGLPGLKLGAADPGTWPSRPVVLPEGWNAIEVERIWVRDQPMRLLAEHGDARAHLTAQ